MPAYSVSIDGKTYTVVVSDDGEVTVDGVRVDVLRTGRCVYSVLVDGESTRVVAGPGENSYEVLISGTNMEVSVETARKKLLKSLAQSSGTGKKKLEVRAPMPALVVKIEVEVGDDVAAGQGLIILEAMKMENELKSHQAGKVKEIMVAKGKPVEKGELLMLLE